MGRFLAVTLVATLLSACGGSSSSAPACAPSGTWKLTDTRTSTFTPNSLCAEPTFATSGSTVGVTYDSTAHVFTWVEDGQQYAGTLDPTACTATISTAASVNVGTDANGAPIIVAASVSRQIAFGATSLSGTGTVAYASDSAALTGLVPCSLNVTTTGAKQ